MQTIVSLDPKGGHYFSLSSVPEVYDVTLLRGFFASESLVGVLVNGTRDNAIKIPQSFPSDSGVKPRAIYTGVHHDYLVEFDVQGNYKKAIELPDSYHFWHFEALGNDDLLALGYDKINPGPQLFILDSSGQVKRNLQIPDRLVDDPVLYDGQSSDVTKQVVAETSMNWWNFALARNKVILYKARTNDPIVEIGSGGVARDISVDYPEGYVLDSIVPANDRWIVRFRKGAIEDAATSGKPIEATSYVLYEADPVDGTLLRQFEISGPFYSIACEHDGVISAFSVQEEKVSLLTAEIQR